MLCGKEVLNPVECPTCEAVHYCSIKHLKLDREQGHDPSTCRRYKSHLASASTIHKEIPFPWYPNHGHSSKCVLLKELRVHNKGAWVRECFCSQGKAYGLDAPILKSLWKKNKTSSEGGVEAILERDTLAERLEDDAWWGGCPEGKLLLTTSLPPADPDTKNLNINSWEEYCTQRKLPLTSPLPILLDMPLNVYWAVQKLKKQRDGVLPDRIIICIAGAEKEVDQWPLFLELGALLPETDIILHFIGPEVPSWADNCSVTVPHIHAASPSPTATAPEDDRKKQKFSTKLHFHAQLLETVLQSRLKASIDVPDIIVGLHAGLGAYASWRTALMSTRQVIQTHEKPDVMLFTDYIAESVFISSQNCKMLLGSLKSASTGQGSSAEGEKKHRRQLTITESEISPFRKPTWVRQAMYSMPYCSNGFAMWVEYK